MIVDHHAVIRKGEKTVLKLLGVKGKVKWSVKKKRPLKIKRAGKNKIIIIAKRDGNATIIAKVKKKKYKMKAIVY